MYIRNAWYVGAWEHEVGRTQRRRIILEEPVMFYRKTDGTPVALEDRCTHRRAPLSKGKLLGDIVQCPYHGLQFNEDGKLICIPSQDRIPEGGDIKSYPVVERNRWIWIWMGDPELADPDLIEDFHWLDDPGWGYGGDRFHLEGNYQLLVDNLLDTTHLTFIHPTTLGTDDFASSECVTERKDDRVVVSRWLMDRPPAPLHQKFGEFPEDAHVDRWQIATFAPPAFVKLEVGSALAGTGAFEGDRSQGISMISLNAITPETEKTTHYFWAQVYDFKVEERWISSLMREQVSTAFYEDLEIIKAQQENMDMGPRDVINLQQDAGGMAARKIVDERLAEEVEQYCS